MIYVVAILALWLVSFAYIAWTDRPAGDVTIRVDEPQPYDHESEASDG